MGWNLRKRYPNAPYFYDFCHWNRPTPYFFALHARGWGKCCFVKHGRNLENVVFLKQNPEIWWILLGTNLIKVWKQNFSSTGSTDQLCIMDEIHWRAGTGHHAPPPVKHRRGYVSYNHPLYDSAHLGSLSKCQAYLRLCERWHLKYKVQHRAHWRAQENFEI